ncbi:PfkB family carbohydrate kinase [Rhodocaloribacter sp.]
MSILAVGTVAVDSIETPFGSVNRVLGGSATYISMAARYLSRPVGLLAVVGGDFPETYMHTLASCDLDLQGIEVKEDEKTFSWGGKYHYDLNDRDTLFTHLNVLANFEPVVPEAYRKSEVVCLGNLDPDIQCEVLDQMNGPEMVICDTMNYWIENTPEGLCRVLERIDCLIVNDAEARELSGEPNLVKAARIIRALGPEILVIKKGEHGALLFADGVVFSAPAYPLEEIQDPTGAGDAFMGGFAGYLASRNRYDIDHLRRAVIYGSAMASFTVEEFGPHRLLALKEAEILKRINAFLTLSHIPISPYFIES